MQAEAAYHAHERALSRRLPDWVLQKIKKQTKKRMTKNRKKNHRSQSESQTDTQRDDRLTLEGVIEECMPGTLFMVRCNENHVALCTLSGKLRMNRIRLLVGDHVSIEVSPYDPKRGRVVWRR